MKKKYDVHQQFLVVFALNTRDTIYENFELKSIQNRQFGLYDTISNAPNNELSDGEIAIALDKTLETYLGDGRVNKYISLINWYAI